MKHSYQLNTAIDWSDYKDQINLNRPIVMHFFELLGTNYQIIKDVPNDIDIIEKRIESNRNLLTEKDFLLTPDLENSYEYYLNIKYQKLGEVIKINYIFDNIPYENNYFTYTYSSETFVNI